MSNRLILKYLLNIKKLSIALFFIYITKTFVTISFLTQLIMLSAINNFAITSLIALILTSRVLSILIIVYSFKIEFDDELMPQMKAFSISSLFLWSGPIALLILTNKYINKVKLLPFDNKKVIVKEI